MVISKYDDQFEEDTDDPEQKQIEIEDDYDPELEESELIQTAEEALNEIIDAAEKDESTGEVILIATTPDGITFSERVHSLDELREFLRGFGFTDPSEEDGIRLFGYAGDTKIEDLDETLIDSILEETQARELFSRISAPGNMLFKGYGGLILPEVKIELCFGK